MVHKEIFKHFLEMSNIDQNDIDVWFQNGRNSIRIRLKNKVEVIFTYDSASKLFSICPIAS